MNVVINSLGLKLFGPVNGSVKSTADKTVGRGAIPVTVPQCERANVADTFLHRFPLGRFLVGVFFLDCLSVVALLLARFWVRTVEGNPIPTIGLLVE